MRDEPTQQKKSTGGLASCGNCGAVVPSSRLVAVGSNSFCADCNRKLGTPAPAAAAPPAGASERPRIARDPGLYGMSPTARPVEIPVPRPTVTSTTDYNRRSLPGLQSATGDAAPPPVPRTSEARVHLPPRRDTSEVEYNDNPTIRDFGATSRPAVPSAPSGRQASFSAAARRTMPEMQSVVDPETGESRLVPKTVSSVGAPQTDTSLPREQAHVTRFRGGTFPPTIPARGPVPGFPHLNPDAPPARPRGVPQTDVIAALTEPVFSPEEFMAKEPGPGASSAPDPASASSTGAPRRVSHGGFAPHPAAPSGPSPEPPSRSRSAVAASRTGEEAVERTDDERVDAPGRRPSRDAFGEYAELRRRIDRGGDDLALRKQAAELAARLGLTLEALEHYKSK